MRRAPRRGALGRKGERGSVVNPIVNPKEMTSDTPQSPNRTRIGSLLEPAIRYMHTSRTTAVIVLAVAVGLLAGGGAIVFRWLIAAADAVFFGGGHRLLEPLGRYFVIGVPAAGGLIVGLLVYFLAREAKGHGVPEVMLAVATEGGRIRPQVAVVKALASAICIGSGGSAGREGPIVQIGSSLGSTIGQVLKLPESRVRTLVACGAAGGISATFNAPIAGAMFALEVILRELSASSFAAIVLSSVTAAAVSRSVLGNMPAFAVPPYRLHSYHELVFYLVLGILAAGVGVAFVRLLYACEDLFDSWRLPDYVKPVLGGLMIGVLGVWAPQAFGVGYGKLGPWFAATFGESYGAADAALIGRQALGFLLFYLVAKMLATSITLGSGGSGGVFAPSLFIGAMLGGAFGTAVHAWRPESTAGPGAYALVGMAAVFAAAAHAPLTSILILFEMTSDYRIILPLMTSAVIASLISQAVSRESIYTLKLTRRGVRLGRPRDTVMDSILVSEAMNREIESVPPDMRVGELMARFAASHHHGFPVVDARGNLVGVVALADVQRAAIDQDVEDLTVDDICARRIYTCFPDQTLSAALDQLGARDVGRLPVVDRLDPRRLVGILRRTEIVSAYARAVASRSRVEESIARVKTSVPDARFIDLFVGEHSALDGISLKEAPLPEDCIVASVVRAGRGMIPHGDTVLEAGDRIVVVAGPGVEEGLRALASHDDTAARHD
jgi:CIC family chloride channel protein